MTTKKLKLPIAELLHMLNAIRVIDGGRQVVIRENGQDRIVPQPYAIPYATRFALAEAMLQIEPLEKAIRAAALAAQADIIKERAKLPDDATEEQRLQEAQAIAAEVDRRVEEPYKAGREITVEQIAQSDLQEAGQYIPITVLARLKPLFRAA